MPATSFDITESAVRPTEVTTVPRIRKLAPAKCIHQSVLPTERSSRMSPPETKNIPLPSKKCVLSSLPFSKWSSLKSQEAGAAQAMPTVVFERIDELEILIEAADEIPVPLPSMWQASNEMCPVSPSVSCTPIELCEMAQSRN